MILNVRTYIYTFMHREHTMYWRTPWLRALGRDRLRSLFGLLLGLQQPHLVNGRTLGFPQSCPSGVPKRTGPWYTLSGLALCSGGHQCRLLGSWGLCSALLSGGHLESVSSHLLLCTSVVLSRPALPTFLLRGSWLVMLQLWLGFGYLLSMLLPPRASFVS